MSQNFWVNLKRFQHTQIARINKRKPLYLLQIRLLLEKEKFKAIAPAFHHHIEKHNKHKTQSPFYRLEALKNMTRLPKESLEAFSLKNETFSPEMLPLDLRAGRNKDNLNNTFKTPAPEASGNIELLKIPTFFHLTPDIIKEHCDELKKFCTPYPKDLEGLDTQIFYSTCLYSGSNFRYDGSQRITMIIPFQYYQGTPYETMKFKLLLGKRYDPVTDSIIIKADKLKTREQNIEYAFLSLMYCIFESKIIRDFEKLAFKQNDLENIDPKVLFNYSYSPKWKRRNIKTIINGKYVRFNRVGHPFLVQLPKLGIKGVFDDPKIKIEPFDQKDFESKTITSSIVKKRIKIIE